MSVIANSKAITVRSARHLYQLASWSNQPESFTVYYWTLRNGKTFGRIFRLAQGKSLTECGTLIVEHITRKSQERKSC